MNSKEETIEVQATGPIKHDGEEYAAGATFTVTLEQARKLHEAGAIEQPVHGKRAGAKAVAKGDKS